MCECAAQRAVEQSLGADLGEHGGLAQLAALRLGGAEFAEDGDGLAREQSARAAAGLDPRGKRLRVERNGAVELCQQRSERAFHLVEERVLFCVQRRGGGGAGGTERQAGLLMNFDRGAGEDRAEFEEAHGVHVAVQIFGEHGRHAGGERGAQHAGLRAERVAHGDGGCGAEGCRFFFSHEGAGDGLAVAEREQRLAEGALLRCVRQLHDGAGEAGQRVGELVVAVDAGDLFDEIDLALEVEPPAWQLHAVDAIAGCCELAAECAQVLRDELFADVGAVERGAEVALDLADAQRDGWAVGSARGELGDDDVGEGATRLAPAL